MPKASKPEKPLLYMCNGCYYDNHPGCDVSIETDEQPYEPTCECCKHDHKPDLSKYRTPRANERW